MHHGGDHYDDNAPDNGNDYDAQLAGELGRVPQGLQGEYADILEKERLARALAERNPTEANIEALRAAKEGLDGFRDRHVYGD